GGSELRQLRPRVYQRAGEKLVEVDGGYRLLKHGQAAFTLAHYDARRPLVIDPTVAFTRFLQGSDEDLAQAVAVDGDGNSYITGYTSSDNFPNKIPDSNLGNSRFGGSDAFVTKLTPDGKTLIYSYIISARGNDWAHAIAVDSQHNVWVTGTTSRDFIVGMRGNSFFVN